MLLAVRISIYGCTWKIWRALKMLELLSAAPRATLTHFSCSPNFPLASITRYTHAKHEQILNFPNQNSPLASTIMFSIDKYMYEENQMIKGKNKTKTKKNNFFLVHFSERWENHEPLSLSVRCFFFLLPENSQVLTFFVPGFALLYAINMGFIF